MSIALTRRVKDLEQEVLHLKALLSMRAADDVNNAVASIAKAAEAVSERMSLIEGQYRALNARVGKALKKNE